MEQHVTPLPITEIVERVVEARLATVTVSEQLIEVAEERLRSEIQDALERLESVKTRTLVIESRSDQPRSLQVTSAHRQLPELLQVLHTGVHAWLFGPAGTGKTTAARHAAEALGRAFYAQSFCASTPLSSLLGYMNATGTYVSTPFRQAYELGGVFLADEIDAANPNVLVSLNMGLDAPVMPFPDGMVQRHPDFVVVAAANSAGSGSMDYTGRNIIDRATIDRFAFIQWDEDPALWAEVDPRWIQVVNDARNIVEELNLGHYISPRAFFTGAKLAQALGPKAAVHMTIIKGLDASQASLLIDELVKRGHPC